jgi:hypothetical protein
MDHEMILEIGQYGVIGLWTLSLLYSNTKMRQDFQARYDKLNENVMGTLKEVQNKVDQGFKDMRERHAQERIRERFTQNNHQL